jgi:hypothetical protein
MSTANGFPLALWLAYWGPIRRWHRYEPEGLEHLDGPGAKLIVGYHGRAFAHDLCMLTVTLHERLGYLPHAVFHGAANDNALLKYMVDGFGFVTGDGDAMEQVVARGEHVIVTPGGTREGCRSFRTRYKVDWGERVGYLRLAIKYGLPIVPVAASGVDDAYVGLNDGYALGKRLGAPARLPVWFALGAHGVWPFSLPFPVKIRQIIGEPIDPHAGGRIDPGDRSALVALHRKVAGTVQGLLDRARSGS